MSPDSSVAGFAERLRHARLTGELVYGDIRLTSTEQAYAVQALVAQQLGWFKEGRPRHWKLGGSPSAGACAAAVVDNDVHPSGWQTRPTVLGFEAELAVRLARDLPAGSTLAQARAAVDAWLPCIEVCASRFAQATGDALLQLADQQLNQSLVLGEPLTLAEGVDWTRLGVSLEADGHGLLKQSGGHPWGDPLAALPWLANHAAHHADGLRAGDMIATGSWIGLLPVLPGATVRIVYEGGGEVQVGFTHQ